MGRTELARKLFFLFFFCYLFSFYADRKSEVLPEVDSLVTELADFPEQSEVDEEGYKFSYRGRDYYVKPKADYYLSGLVVSRNDISAFSDIYHTEDSVDFMDICLIWGDNALVDAYKNIEFWSEPFSCWWRSSDREKGREFVGEHLSNTHLLSGDRRIISKMNRVKIGDQVRLRGQLVDYAPALYPELKRKTSLIRGDTGNGACEVMMVDSFELIEEANPAWRRVFSFSRSFSWLFLFLSVLFFFKETYWPKRRTV